jgi:hypothetical protein
VHLRGRPHLLGERLREHERTGSDEEDQLERGDGACNECRGPPGTDERVRGGERVVQGPT